MTLTLEGRVEVLEGKVKNLETWAGPGQNEGLADNLADLRRQFVKFGEVQAKQSQTLDIHTGKLGALERAVNDNTLNMHRLARSLTDLRDETSGKLERLDNDVATLKTDVATLKTDVATLKTDVATLKTDVATLKTDVAGLKTDVAGLRSELTEFKVEVRGTLKEILERLPAKAA